LDWVGDEPERKAWVPSSWGYEVVQIGERWEGRGLRLWLRLGGGCSGLR